MEKENFFLTIAVTNYNNEMYIGRCLNSIVGQLTNIVEVLVIDDGSTDDSLSVINKFAATHDGVRVIVETNSGVSVARNRAIDEANGTYVTFVDSDDEITPGGVKIFCDALRSHKPDVLVTDCVLRSNESEVQCHSFNCCGGGYGQESLVEILSCCLEGPGFCRNETMRLTGAVWDKAYSVAFLKENGLRFDPALRRAQDIAFNVLAFRQATCIYYEPVVTYRYWIIDSSNSHRLNPNLLWQIELYLRNVKQQVVDIGDFTLLNDYSFHAINQIEPICASGGFVERGYSLASALKEVAGRDLFANAIKDASVRSLGLYKENFKLFLYKLHAYRVLATLFAIRKSAFRNRV